MIKNKVLVALLIICFSSCLKNENIKINRNTTPEKISDSWEVSTPSAQGFEQSSLDKATDYFFSEENLLHSKALLIVRNNKLIYEAYCKNKSDRDQVQNIKSVTKSITSVATGIAVKQGIIDSNLQELVYDYIPENFDQNIEKKNITIEQCLRMTTGLEDPFYSINSVLPDNSVTTSLSTNLISTPGAKHYYNNGSANILGGVISKSAKVTFEKFVTQNLFNPLGIKNTHWIKHSDGLVNPAFDLYLLPRDVLTFGQFCLNNGNWNNSQIIPNTWLSKSTAYSEDGFDGKFGYHWWINDKYNGYYANGHGGQRVFIFPDKDLVIVHLAEPSTDDTDLSEIPVLLDLIMEAVQ